MSGVNRLSVFLSLRFIPLSIPILCLSLALSEVGGAGGGRSFVGYLWQPVGVLLLTFRSQIIARLRGFIDARSTWRFVHSR